MKNNNGAAMNQALEKVLTYQDEVKKAVRSIADIEAVIEVQQTIITDAGNYETRLPDLHTSREDLLAEMITGGASKEELAALDEEIGVEKERLDRHVSHEKLAAPDAKQAIAGLRRKLDVAVAAFEALKNKRPAVLTAFLKATAERLGAEYMQQAMGLIETYRLLLVYGRQFGFAGSGSGAYIAPSHDMSIPLFGRLETHQGYDKPNIPGQIWNLTMIHNPDCFNDAVKEERARIAALGVEW